MKKIYDAVERFCARHPRFGIPNLMRYIVIGNVVVYFLSMLSSKADATALDFLVFNLNGLLHGEVWRLVTFVFVPEYFSPFALIISLYFYYWIGSILERDWGTAKFTLYYAGGALLTLLGFDPINRYCAELGLTQSCVQRKMLDFAAVEAGRNNYTSPADLYRIFELLYHGKILTQPLRDVAFDFLGRSRSFDGLQRYIPDPVPVLHKPGGLDHLNHDAGIFLLEDNPYFLGIFTWDGPALDGQPQQLRLIGRLSRMVYDYRKGGLTP